MSRSLGYTIIELVIVMAIIGILAAMALIGLRSQNNNQLVQNAQLEFIANLRSMINGVNQGSNGQNFKYLTIGAGSNTYTVSKSDGTTITTYSLPSNVYACPQPSTTLIICAANPNFTAYTVQSGTCGCSVGSYFACQPGSSTQIGNNGPASVTIRFSQTSDCNNAGNVYHKDVVIEGNGMQITRVNPL